MSIQAVRVNDWLETEILRLNHLRDRASEKGRRKELRECVEKLQLLNTPEERQRRLQEVPEVHADPNMDPSYESEEEEREQDDNKRGNFMRPRDSGFSRRGREQISPGKQSSASNDTWSATRKNSTSWEPERNFPIKSTPERGDGGGAFVETKNESSWNQGRDAVISNNWEKPKGSDSGAWNSQVRSGSASGAAPVPVPVPIPVPVPPIPTSGTQSSNISETDKIWHYQDPAGKIQGPFSMSQLRKWSTTGYFPPDLRIWKTMEKQVDSILLNDAIIGKFHKETPQWVNNFSESQKATSVSTNVENNRDGGWRANNSSKWTDQRQSDVNWNSNSNRKDAGMSPNGGHEYAKGGRDSRSSSWNARVTNSSSREWDSSKGNNAWSNQPHSPHSSKPSNQGKEVQGGERWNSNSGLNRGAWGSNSSTGFHSNTKSWGSSGQSAGVNLRARPEINSPKGWDTSSKAEGDMLNLHSPTPKQSNTGWTGGQRSENKWSATPSPNPSSGGWTSQGRENNWAASPTVPIQQTTIGWGSGAQQFSPMVIQPIKSDAEWGGPSPTPAKSSSKGWGPDVVPASIPNPTNNTNNHAATAIMPEIQNPQASFKPTEGIDTSSGSHPQTTVPDPNVSTSMIQDGDLGRVSENVDSSSLLGSNPTPDRQIPSQSVTKHESNGLPNVASVFKPLEISEANFPTVDPSAQNSHQTYGWGSTSAQASEMVSSSPKPESKSHGWEATPGQKQEPNLNPMPALAVQVPEHFSTTEGSDWSKLSPTPPVKPSSWDVGQGIVGGPQNNSFAPPIPCETASNVPPPAAPTSVWGMGPTENAPNAWKSTPDTANTGWGPTPGNSNIGWGPSQGSTPQGNANVGWGGQPGNPSTWGSQQNQGNQGGGFQGGDSGHGGGRPGWNRQPSFGSGGSRQRVCKFHESGHCKKGADCDYLHT